MRPRTVEIVRGATALLLLVTLLMGLPTALVTTVGWPLPTEMPSWSALERLLTTGELDSWTLVKALAVLVWLAWAQLTSSAIAEAAAIARGRRTARIPSPRPLRLSAANLVTTAALLFGSAGRLADAATPPPPDLHTALATDPPAPSVIDDDHLHDPGELGPQLMSEPAVDQPSPIASLDGASVPSTWHVAPRDTLWSIADKTLGDGLRWREIHALNVGRQQPDGGALRPGDDLIRPGWTLQLPSDATVPQPAAGPTAEETSRADTGAGSATITVQPGDTLWALADTHLDDPSRWPDLYQANVDRPQPDGRRLSAPDLIHPGWQLQIPTADADGDSETPATVEGSEPTADASPDTTTTSERDPVPWAQLDRDTPPPSPPAQLDDPEILSDHAADNTDPPQDTNLTADDQAEAEGEDETATGDPADQPDAWERSVLRTGAGLAAAGMVLTLDRLRRSRLRRRGPGQRIRLPEGNRARTEQRIRGLADQDTAHLLDIALRSLAAACVNQKRPVPDIALVSVGHHDVAGHLAVADTNPPDGWRSEDAGMTWVLPRPADLEPLRELAATALSPAPLLVTIGTHANDQRRVLLNLGYARSVSIDADEQTTRTTLLAQTLELATTARADGLQILLTGADDRLATLERVRCPSDTEALELLRRAIAEEAADDTVATAAIFLSPPPPELQDTFAAGSHPAGMVTAVGPHLPEAPWRLTIDRSHVRVDPYGLELQPLELTGDDLETIDQLLIDAATLTFVEADLDELDAETPLHHLANGQPGRSPRPANETPGEDGVEIRVLGSVEIAGASEFGSAKAEELVVYLAFHRSAVDTDTLQEALWPGQAPSAGRLHTTVWRARQALGDDPDGEPYLPQAKHGRYRLSPRARADLDRLYEHVRRAGSEPQAAIAELRAALELVRGQPLSATSGEYAWSTYQIHAIEQQISDAAHNLAQRYLERGEPGQARWAADRGLLADPYCEMLYRDLMLAAAATGNRAEIHATMQRLRHLLAEDVEANDADDLLDPATTRLYQELMPRKADPTDASPQRRGTAATETAPARLESDG